MKKRFLSILLILMALVSFNMKVDAAPASIPSGSMTQLVQFISGPTAYDMVIPGTSNRFYCLNQGKAYRQNSTYYRYAEAPQGFVYMMQNKPKTGDNAKNQFIMQYAVWFYEDIVNGNNYNLTVAQKNNIRNNRNNYANCAEVCSEIMRLVEGAQNYKTPTGNASFSKTVSFTEQGEYFVSNTITVTSNGISNFKGINLVDAPSGTQIINQKITNGNGTFQVRVPISSINYSQSKVFNVTTGGTYKIFKAYKYRASSTDTTWQNLVYDVLDDVNKSVSASLSMTVKRGAKPTTPTSEPTSEPVITTQSPTNSLKIKKIDEDKNYVSGAELTLYKGNCLETICLEKDVYSKWTTVNTLKEFKDIPVGKYTLVETKTPKGYKTADKALIDIKRNDTNYSYSLVNVLDPKQVRISKTDVTGSIEIAGATLTVKNKEGKVISTWVSEATPKYLTLEEGEYTLTEQLAPEGYKLNEETVYFKVDKYGNVKVKDATGKYIEVSHVIMMNFVNDLVIINKFDKNTNTFLKGAILEILNEKGEQVSKWTTDNTSFSIALNPGEYTLKEVSAPKGYIKNDKPIYFKLTKDGTLLIRNEEGIYVISGGIIIYNEPEKEYTTVEVPKTGLSSTLTYIMGTITLLGGGLILRRNGKINI